MSPLQLRDKVMESSLSSCSQAEKRRETSDEESEPASPNGARRSQRTQAGQYCTHDCLRGLAEGNVLDQSCPNARAHGELSHQIDRPTFLVLMRQQLADDLDTDCGPVGMHGAFGVPFRVRLRSHEYTVAAKATPDYFIPRLQQEASIYEQLGPIQGIHVPVYLGNIDLQAPYYYEGVVDLVHMMFFSFGGKPIRQYVTAENKEVVLELVKRSADAIHGVRVLHKDLVPRSTLWNEDTKHIMVVNFERAEVRKRAVQEYTLANLEWNKAAGSSTKLGQTMRSAYTLEMEMVVFELNMMADSIQRGYR